MLNANLYLCIKKIYIYKAYSCFWKYHSYLTFDIDLKSVIYFCVIVIEFGGFGVVCSEVTGSPGGDEPCGLIVGFCSVAATKNYLELSRSNCRLTSDTWSSSVLSMSQSSSCRHHSIGLHQCACDPMIGPLVFNPTWVGGAPWPGEKLFYGGHSARRKSNVFPGTVPSCPLSLVQIRPL